MGVGVFDFQPLNQRVGDGGVLNDPAHLGQIGLGVQRLHRPLEAFPIVGRAEVAEARRGACTVLEFVGGEGHRANLSCTARRRAWMMATRSAAVTVLVSAGNDEAMSSKDTTCALGVGAVDVRTHRRIIAPLLWPAVSSQLATPGSRAHSTTRTNPSESTTA